MNLPEIDIDSLPDLPLESGVFGSASRPAAGLSLSDDLILILMVYVYQRQ
ncbi:MAG: hypothetical protein KGL48_06470 [Sphingomonadales bacterium]|nr:hypothetical protein [Sphingomonadales bacterium]MDE2568566.1 hypothetical protein [Sphingomonadales bacterium]